MAGMVGLAVVALVAGSESPAAGAAGAAAPALSDLVVTEVPADPTVGSPRPCAGGSRVVRLGPGGGRTVLSGQMTACDPALDAAARVLVFRGRERDSAPWRIWRLALGDGDAEASALTTGAMDCRRPTFLVDGVAAVCDGDLYRITGPPDAESDPDSDPEAEPVRLTSSGGAVRAGRVIPDGRLLLEIRDAAGTPLLLTAQPDGTWATRWRDRPVPGLQAFRPLAAGALPGALADGLLLAVEGEGAGLWLGSLDDPLAPLRRVWPIGPVGPVGPESERPADEGSLRDPSVLPGGGVLVAFRPGAEGRYGIYRLGLGPDGGELEEVASVAGHALQPLAVVPRRPDTAIPGIVKPELNTGYLVLFDAARSDHPELAGIDREEIAAVRIFPWADGPTGETAVDLEPAADGSLHLEVPSDRPYGMALVGRGGHLLGPAGGPFWVRPNERRACMGCHVSVRYAPPNVRPEALEHPPQWVGWDAERRGPRSELEEGSH
jgi:hypothetical protein